MKGRNNKRSDGNEKINKKYLIIAGIVLSILLIGALAIFYVTSNANLSPDKYQNKVFLSKDGDMFFTEEYEMLNYSNIDGLKTNMVVYFDENYVYSFVPSNLPVDDWTKSIESKSEYEVTGNQLNFIIHETAYSAYIKNNGDLELKVIGTKIENDPVVGTTSIFKAHLEYEYTALKEKYMENRSKSWAKLKEKLVQEIGQMEIPITQTIAITIIMHPMRITRIKETILVR